jgi:hypothetical protein
MHTMLKEQTQQLRAQQAARTQWEADKTQGTGPLRRVIAQSKALLARVQENGGYVGQPGRQLQSEISVAEAMIEQDRQTRERGY